MKRLILYIVFIVVGFALGAGTIWMVSKNNETVPTIINKISPLTDNAVPTESFITTEYSNKQLLDFAYDALTYIRMKDYSSLASIVHPEYGLVFSPGTTVNLNTNKCFTSKQVSGFGDDRTDYVWGAKANGELIELTPEDYFTQYVYVFDYANADLIGINKVVRSGDALENVEDVFPDSNYIDFYVSGLDQEDSEDTISWSILRLVFEKYREDLMLTAIIHSEYTA